MRTDSLISGHLDLLVLSIVARRPMHGYAIMEALRERSQGKFDVPEGTLYPALYRLEHQGWLGSRTKLVERRKRRLYSLTPRGRSALARERQDWELLSRGIRTVIGHSSPTPYTPNPIPHPYALLPN